MEDKPDQASLWMKTLSESYQPFQCYLAVLCQCFYSLEQCEVNQKKDIFMLSSINS